MKPRVVAKHRRRLEIEQLKLGPLVLSSLTDPSCFAARITLLPELSPTWTVEKLQIEGMSLFLNRRECDGLISHTCKFCSEKKI